MEPKPSHYSAAYGAWFKDPLVIAAYPARPPYPPELFTLLRSLAVDTPCTVLDIGAGTGDIARRLAPLVDHVTAVDFSAGMIELGQRLSGGDAPNLTWIHAAVEEASLEPPYALVTAGESLHWMAWDIVLPRLADALAPRGVLAIVEREWNDPDALRPRVIDLIARYSPVRDYRPHALTHEIERRGLFHPVGMRRCGPIDWTPTIDEYIEARHSQRGCSRTHMGPEAVAAFDANLRALLEEQFPRTPDGRLQLTVGARVTWGTPSRTVD